MNSGTGEAVVREFVRAFNEGDIECFIGTLSPEIELHSMKGKRQGIEAARAWATRSPGGVQQTVVINSVEVVGEKVLARIRRDWRWAEDGSLAGSDELAWVFHLKDGLVETWIPFTDMASAFAAISS